MNKFKSMGIVGVISLGQEFSIWDTWTQYRLQPYFDLKLYNK